MFPVTLILGYILIYLYKRDCMIGEYFIFLQFSGCSKHTATNVIVPLEEASTVSVESTGYVYEK